jgi:hypothetical protein
VVGKCEDVLEWPIFEGKFHRSETETLILRPELAREDQPGSTFSVTCDPARRSTPGRGIQEEETLALLEKPFLNVHIKNPILDAADTRIIAKDVMEHRFKWDAPSCLVVRDAKTPMLTFDFLSNTYLASGMRLRLFVIAIQIGFCYCRPDARLQRAL